MTSSDYFEFFSQAKIMSGNRAMSNIPIELDGFDARKPLVVTSKEVTKAGLGKKFARALYDSNVVIGAIFDEVPYYAGISQVRDLAKLFRDRGCDSLIAIGGGAAADVAKCVNVMVSGETDDILQFVGEDRITRHLKPFIYVAASGSTGYEASNRAMIEGRVIRSDFLFPDVICIDRSMVSAKNGGAVLEGAMVAFAQAVEAADMPNNNPVVDAYAHAAIQFICENLRKGIRSPGDKNSGLALANAAAMGAIAFSNSPEGTVHLLSKSLARVTGLSESLCTAVLLPYSLELKLGRKEPFRGDLLLVMAGFETFASTPEKERPRAALELIRQLLAEVKQYPRALKDVKVAKYRLDEAARAAAEEGDGRVDLKDCMTILEHAWEGTSIL
ncbi:MAG TPA: iron-containing alcohol dehydrogenase [Spirochaetota bacterium]|nr:iron-containing alcohol dehydrogenase [Spirochaetota bacterium]HPV41976.1 iron-containing alcohol dehydrogenase [Spirochaetota bacterium]